MRVSVTALNRGERPRPYPAAPRPYPAARGRQPVFPSASAFRPCYDIVMVSSPGAEHDRTQLLVAEYAALRNEILTLVELQFKITASTVISLGTVLSVGVQTKNPAIVLVHPILSLIMGINWLHHTFRIHRIAAYLRDRVEAPAGHDVIGWETYVKRTPLPIGRASYWGLRAAFVASSLLAVGVAVAMRQYDTVTVVLLCVASCATALTCVMFYRWREPAPEILVPPPVGLPRWFHLSPRP